MLYVYLFVLALVSVVILFMFLKMIYLTFQHFNAEYNELRDAN
jgi:hypothetical protein